MFRQFFLLLSVAILCSCQSISSQRTTTASEQKKAKTIEPDQFSDPWIHDAGTIARSELEREPVQDPLGLRNVFTSQKAREIERNLGVGD